MKNNKKTMTMLLTAAVLLVSVFMTGCTSPTEPKNSTPSGIDASAESDGFGVYVKLERTSEVEQVTPSSEIVTYSFFCVTS